MGKIVHVTFDGKNLVPEEILQLPVNARFTVEIPQADPPGGKKGSWMEIAASANLEGPGDLSERLDDYLYGEKRGQY